MSLQITLTTPKVIVKQPEITETVTAITIDRIVDIPAQKKVVVFVGGKRIELDALSGDNYDSPNEWTNADVVDAVKTRVDAFPFPPSKVMVFVAEAPLIIGMSIC